ncbi:glutathione synthetase-like isoform X1 [Genypterus blacodes]|uniref:glutathione synthetase-like isoform X1 n=1 Tax=Genypterus blacodes TaxID=154954 RepID=UPI003F77298D
MEVKKCLQELMLDPDGLKYLVDEAKELVFLNGILRRTDKMPNSSEVVSYMAFTLFPTPLPKAVLLQALAVQTHFNTLVDKISQDPDFLEEALAGTVQTDEFTAKLFDIYKTVQQEGQTQSIVLGVNRSDYMMEEREDGSLSMKQTEINTISVGSFGVTDSLPVVHRHMLRLVGLQEESQRVPDTLSTHGVSRALAKAWELYGQPKAVLMFLVEEVELTKLNHRVIENKLWERGIPVIRRKFEDVSKSGFLDGDKKLFVDGLEVAVVYYRYGYMPDQYTEQSWDARLMMERSLAVKCPDIGTHLAGTKKVQQVLARPGVLEKFFPNQPQVVEQIRETFTGLYTLDMGSEGDQTVAMALANPHCFVLKPQREAGGNNFCGESLVRVLEEVKNDKRRASYILMDRIRPKIEQNFLVQRGQPVTLASVFCEIGVCGAYVRHGGEMVLNEVTGHCMKTCDTKYDDGGEAARHVYDSPLIV